MHECVEIYINGVLACIRNHTTYIRFTFLRQFLLFNCLFIKKEFYAFETEGDNYLHSAQF